MCHWREQTVSHLTNPQMTSMPQNSQKLRSAVHLTHALRGSVTKKRCPIKKIKNGRVGGRMRLGYITNKVLAYKGIQRERSVCIVGIHLTGELTAASYLQPNWSAILLTELSWKRYRKRVCLGSTLLYQSKTAGTRALSTMPGIQQQQTEFQTEKKGKWLLKYHFSFVSVNHLTWNITAHLPISTSAMQRLGQWIVQTLKWKLEFENKEPDKPWKEIEGKGGRCYVWILPMKRFHSTSRSAWFAKQPLITLWQ